MADCDKHQVPVKAEDALCHKYDNFIATALTSSGKQTHSILGVHLHLELFTNRLPFLPGVGLAAGGLLSLLFFKRRAFPIHYGVGIGIGYAVKQLELELNSNKRVTKPCC